MCDGVCPKWNNLGNRLSQSSSLPPAISATVDDWSAAFITVALFTLGTAIASDTSEKDNNTNNYNAATPVMLVLVKM